jgi:hypothetical protein
VADPYSRDGAARAGLLPPGQIDPIDAVRLLAKAREAWQRRETALAEIARLSKYRHMTRGMQDDLGRWRMQCSAAEHTLQQLLAAPAGSGAAP